MRRDIQAECDGPKLIGRATVAALHAQIVGQVLRLPTKS